MTRQHRHDKALYPTACGPVLRLVPHLRSGLSAAGELGRCVAARSLAACGG